MDPVTWFYCVAGAAHIVCLEQEQPNEAHLGP